MNQTFEATLEEGRFLLDECKQYNIRVWIGKTGSLLRANLRGRRYFIEALKEHEYAVKLALEQERNEE